MAQLALATIGAVIGGTVGGPAGASVGWTIGMTLGSALFPPDLSAQIGPRLTDRHLTTSTWGAPIHRLWGQVRTGGNVIWGLDIIEERNTRTEGENCIGKGGAEVTTFSYYGTFAVAFGRGPVDAITRIWADGKLIWERDPYTGLVNSKIADRVTFYLGTEDQLADPTIEADKGAGQVPGFRGLVHVVFNRLPLADYGNRLPQIEVEVNGIAAASAYQSFDTNILLTSSAYARHGDGDTQSLYFVGAAEQGGTTYPAVYKWDIASDSAVGLWVADWTDAGRSLHSLEHVALIDGRLYVGGRVSGALEHALIELDPAAMTLLGVAFLPGQSALGTYRPVRAGANTVAFRGHGQYSLVDTSHTAGMWSDGVTHVLPYSRVPEPSPAPTGAYSELVADGSGSLWRLDNVYADAASFGGRTIVLRRHNPTTETWDTFTPWQATGFLQAASAQTFLVAEEHDWALWLLYDAARDQLIGFGQDTGATVEWATDMSATAGRLFAYDLSSGVIVWNALLPAEFTSYTSHLVPRPARHAIERSGDLFLYSKEWTGLSARWYVVDPAFGTFEGTILNSLAFPGAPGVAEEPIMVAANVAYADEYAADDTIRKYTFGAVATQTTLTLDTIVRDLCVTAGLVEGSDFDVTALAGKTVIGYLLAREMTCRKAIEPLQQAFFVDAVESGGKLVFAFRTGTSLGAVAEADLAAMAEGGEARPRVTETRLQEAELPRAVLLSYASTSIDFLQAVQQARRISPSMFSTDETHIEVPIVLEDSEAKQIAEKALYHLWIGRTSVAFALPVNAVAWEPGDVVTLTVAGVEMTVYIAKVGLGADLTLSFEGTLTDEVVYQDSDAAPTVPTIPAQVVPTLEPTTLHLLDPPLLTESDDAVFGFYAAAHGTSDAWKGAVVYSSADGASFTAAFTRTVPAPAGQASTALAWAPHELVDRDNSVRVRLAYGGLDSVSELAMLNGANRALLGDELIAFATATDLGGGEYQLSVLLRGLQGSEWASGTHAAGDAFVLLAADGSVAPVIRESSALGLARDYKGVSVGDTPDAVAAQSFTPTGRRWTPLAPAHLSGSRDGAGNLTLAWTRRARLAVEWRDGTEDVPLDEPSEAYEVDILDGAAVVRTIAVSSPTASYSAAEQTSDFGAPQSALTVRVHQMSTRVGRGYPAEGTV